MPSPVRLTTLMAGPRRLVGRLTRSLAASGLRFRFLVVAAAVALVVIVAALATSVGVRNTAASNAEAIALRDTVRQQSDRIHTSVWLAETTLHYMLITPQPGQEKAIGDSLAEALSIATSLQADPVLARTEMARRLTDLQTRLVALENQFRYLVEHRRDNDWVYPALPLISGTMLRSNTEFITAVGLALDDLAAAPINPQNVALYRHLSEIRDLWRRIIVVFRASMIRYAGLHDEGASRQEEDIEALFGILGEKLAATRGLFVAGVDQFLVEDALRTMEVNAESWYADMDSVSAMRRSGTWRADVTYFVTNLQPRLREIYGILRGVESELADWSTGNLNNLEKAAASSASQFWLLAVFSLIFIVLAYIVLDRSVLGPVEQVAAAIRKAALGPGLAVSMPGAAPEVRQLVEAFEKMQQQIRDRQQALEHQALHDALTGLPNRVLMSDRLEHALTMARRRKTGAGFVLLDLNRFKEINDTLGHHVGDRLLQQVAERLQESMRDSDTVARLGGDEFAVVVVDADTAVLKATAERITAVLDRTLSVDGHELYVGASLGIAVFPEHGEDPATLIRHADTAMYESKRTGATVTFYTSMLDEHAVGELSLISDLRNGLEHDLLHLHYQPRIRLSDGNICGVEALLRWQHPERGNVSPERIALLAEYTGLIDQLTWWVIDRALEDCDQLLRSGQGLHVSVNVSTRNLQDTGFAQRVGELLARRGLSSGALVLEVTESAVMTDPVKARRVLGELRDLGVQLAVDDFGTGFSSLGYLKLLPVNELKIDKSFVIDMLEDENDLTIVRSTIELAHNLGLQVTAEGVESAEVLDRLARMGCDHAQGFYIGKPSTVEGVLKRYGAVVATV